MVHCRLEGPRPWICKDFNGFGGSQALDLEGFQWIWRVPGLGFDMISMDLEGPRPCVMRSRHPNLVRKTPSPLFVPLTHPHTNTPTHPHDPSSILEKLEATMNAGVWGGNPPHTLCEICLLHDGVRVRLHR